jgi:hypothetical protein
MLFKHPRAVQAEFSSETQTTLWKTIPILECLPENWENLLKLEKFAPVHAAIKKGLEKKIVSGTKPSMRVIPILFAW